MKDHDLINWKLQLNQMTQLELAKLQRFAPVGHPVFVSGSELYDLFSKRFKELGGMTPDISRIIGWDR